MWWTSDWDISNSWLTYWSYCGRRNILIQVEEIVRIVLGLDRDHPIPPLAVGFRDTILLIAAHEVYVHTWPHGGPKSVEQSANP